MSIQSHTVTHRPLAHMGVERVLFELSESKRIIEERLGQEVRHLSLPHGSMNGLTLSIAKEAGYMSICTSDIGFQSWESKAPWIRRINVGDGISEKKFQLIAQAKSRGIWIMKLSKDLKNTLRETIGHDNYRKLYQWVYVSLNANRQNPNRDHHGL